MPALGFQPHDHSRCVSDALAEAEARCARDRLQFTPVRRRVFEILLQEHRALGAYEILKTLSDEGLGSQPPVAYRALDFLVKAGLAHRIERLNAYIACSHLTGSHAPAFLICRNCKGVAETDVQIDDWANGPFASAPGFHVERVALEAEGLCAACLETKETDGPTA
ncbi:MAG: transcriptional repressor [Marinibacterium sp.]|nr:transcriptional repressor [Marinibacterium sp.]